MHLLQSALSLAVALEQPSLKGENRMSCTLSATPLFVRENGILFYKSSATKHAKTTEGKTLERRAEGSQFEAPGEGYACEGDTAH